MKEWMKCCVMLLLLIQVSFLHGQQISGQVLDYSTQLPVPFATIFIQHTSIGTTADNDGYFSLKLNADTTIRLTVSSIGYQEKTQQITPSELAVSFYIKPVSTDLNQIVIAGNKKVKKDTAAIRLYRRIVKNKQKNSIASIRSYSYNEYEKTEYAIANVKNGIINKNLLKRAPVINDYMDTTALGIAVLPVLLRERLTEVYFEEFPPRRKVILRGERFDGVDDYYKYQITEKLFEELDIYQNIIRIQDKGFISPFADNALPIYKYFIADTIFIQQEQYIVLEFTPKRKGDLAFTGSAIIHDNSAAIFKIDVRLVEQANLNFVAGLKLNQEFKQIGNFWFKKDEKLAIQLNLTNNQNHQNVRIVQSISRSNIQLNEPIKSSIFNGQPYTIDKAVWEQSSKYWDTIRPVQLTKQEQGIAHLLDTVKNTRLYKRSFWLAHALNTGYLGIGPLEVGRWESLFSWNAIEGNRFKFGIRNNRYLFKQRYNFKTYIAYGDKDKLFKYHFWNEWTINKPNSALWSALGGYYHYDWSYDFTYNRWWSYDRIFQSISRIGDPLSSLFLLREGSIYYEQEVVDNIFARLAATHKTIYSWPEAYQFTDLEENPNLSDNQQFSVVDFHMRWKFSLPSRKKEQQKIKSLVNFKRPYLEVDYHFSPNRFMGSDFSYHLFKLAINQEFNSPIGRSIVDLKGGKLFGTVPFPLLEIHQGNQSFSYNKYGYNLMNDFEYASDTWGELWFEHHFDGLLFNLLPFNKKLKIRSLVSFKTLTGSLTPANKQFLEDAYQLKPIESGYFEMGFGFENLARVIRIDLLWRITQKNLPETRNFGIRWQFKPTF